MELFEAKNLSFCYATADSACLCEQSFQIEKGEFVLLFGKTGCGKSTLLKQWKPSIRPEGKRTGTLLFDGKSIDALDQREEASFIGYVSQNPDNQIVTDKVWHELAFTLENLGVETEVIRKRVAEIAVFFGMTNWFHKSIEELSGGQKQILNLASVMITRPKLLLLDEPTSQLDPVATVNFVNLLVKIHEEIGTTILMAEHRLEEVYAKVNRCMVMENGKLICFDSVERTAQYLHEKEKEEFALLPLQARLPIMLKKDYHIRTIGQAKHFLETNAQGVEVCQRTCGDSGHWKNKKESAICSIKNVWFRYEREGNDILRDFSLDIMENDIFALVGANGQGKSTFLKVLTGILKPYRGSISYEGQKIKRGHSPVNVALLPQNPQTLFLKNTVEEDLKSVSSEIQSLVDKLGIGDLMAQHPYDLSGGQQQMVALAKVLLTKPKLLLLDEPTKGVDQIKKKQLGKLLHELQSEGMTIILVSHDVDFCATYADTVGMMFDGIITSIGNRKTFFMEQYFYTTTCLKICREVYKGMIIEEEVLEYETNK